MFKQVLFYTGIALSLVLIIIVPALFYRLAGQANIEWTLYGFICSNIPSITGTLMIVTLIAFRSVIMGAPRKH